MLPNIIKQSLFIVILLSNFIIQCALTSPRTIEQKLLQFVRIYDPIILSKESTIRDIPDNQPVTNSENSLFVYFISSHSPPPDYPTYAAILYRQTREVTLYQKFNQEASARTWILKELFPQDCIDACLTCCC